MRHFFILLKHELRMLMISPATYIAAVLFLCLMGYLFWAILRGMVNTPEDVLPAVRFLNVFWIPVLFVVPLLTMRSVAGERNDGTLGTLMTTPASRAAIILSKFAGAYIFYMLLWFMTLGFPKIAVEFFPQTAVGSGLLSQSSVLGSFLFLSLSGVLFISIGIFASSITRSQLVAGMFCFTALFLVIVGGQQLSNISAYGADMTEWAKSLVDYFQVFGHLDDFSRGVLDTRPFFYYLSLGGLLLGLATLVIEAKA
ncbi:MAG: ABC transporter permease [Verrucomicrobiota bacterium]